MASQWRRSYREREREAMLKYDNTDVERDGILVGY